MSFLHSFKAFWILPISIPLVLYPPLLILKTLPLECLNIHGQILPDLVYPFIVRSMSKIINVSLCLLTRKVHNPRISSVLMKKVIVYLPPAISSCQVKRRTASSGMEIWADIVIFHQHLH